MKDKDNISKQLAAYSIRQNLDRQRVVDLYIREGIIDRFSHSLLNQKYVLKGASAFQAITQKPHRPTKDVDFLGFGNNNEKFLREEFSEIIKVPVDDGIVFDDISSSILQKGGKYQGVRLDLKGKFADAPIKGQVDIGFGSVIYPEAVEGKFPTLLGRQAPKIRHYPKETICAEKFEAVTSLGLRNSRLKDFYDLLYLARNFEFDGTKLSKALAATFRQRGTILPQDNPVGLTEQFVTYKKEREKLWKDFYSSGTMKRRPKLNSAIAEISNFVMPVSQAAATKTPFSRVWQPDSGWQVSPEFSFKDYQIDESSSPRAEQSQIEQSTKQSDLNYER